MKVIVHQCTGAPVSTIEHPCARLWRKLVAAAICAPYSLWCASNTIEHSLIVSAHKLAAAIVISTMAGNGELQRRALRPCSSRLCQRSKISVDIGAATVAEATTPQSFYS